MLFKKGVLKNFAEFTGKLGVFIKNETPTQVFPCEFCEIFKNSFFYRTPPMTTSESFILFLHIRWRNCPESIAISFFSERFFPVSLIWRWYVFDRHKKYLQYEWSRKVECCPQLHIYKVLMHTLIVWHNNDHNDRILNTFAIFNEKFYWKLIQVEWCERVSCFHVVSLTSLLNSL